MLTFRFWFHDGYVDAQAPSLEEAMKLPLFTISNGKQFACFHPHSAYKVEELKD